MALKDARGVQFKSNWSESISVVVSNDRAKLVNIYKVQMEFKNKDLTQD